MKQFERLMTTARPHLPGAVDDAIRQELFLVCHDFYKKSQAWREEIDFTILRGDTSGMVMPFAGKIDTLLWVEDKGGFPVRGAYMPESNVVALRHPAQETGQYKAFVNLTVTDPTTKDAYPIVPAAVVEEYTDELLSGLLARMMAQPNKPYTNLPLAQFHNSKFNGGAARAYNSVNTGNVRGGQRWAFPQNFKTVR